MNHKFLVFSVLVSSLIVLVSLVYYIHTGYRLRVENENVQEMNAKLETAVVDGWITMRSAPTLNAGTHRRAANGEREIRHGE